MSDRSTIAYKVRFVSFFALAYGFLYVFPNLRPLYEPFVLPQTSFEKNLPLVPWTVLLYTSDYFLVGSAVFLLKELPVFQRFARRATLVLLISGLCFWLFPTQYPRPELSTPTSFSEHLLSWVWFIDAPTNCFPSLHVGFTTLAVFSVSSGLRPFYALWALAVFASVLTTKQHYLWDIGGGVVFALLCSALVGHFEKGFPKIPPRSRDLS